MEESALVIPVSLPCPLDRIRQEFDPLAKALPAHVSLLIPFAPRLEGTNWADRLQQLLESFCRFTLTCNQVGSFHGPLLDTLYLSIADNPTLARLMDLVYMEFPEYPPYGGKHPEIIPHVTVARVCREDVGRVRWLVERALLGLDGVLALPAEGAAWISYDPQLGWTSKSYPFSVKLGEGR